MKNRYILKKYYGNQSKYDHYRLYFPTICAKTTLQFAVVDRCFVEQTDMKNHKWVIYRKRTYCRKLDKFLHRYVFFYGSDEGDGINVYFKDNNPMNIRFHNLHMKNVTRMTEEDKYLQSIYKGE